MRPALLSEQMWFRVMGLAAVVMVLPLVAWSQPRLTPAQRPDELEIWVLTVSPGAEVASRFGHTAMWIRHTPSGRERIYSFGLFDFGLRMIPQVVTGRLRFRAGELLPQPVFAEYRSSDREVHAQRIDLPAHGRLDALRALRWSVEADNREYLYDHFADNCTTRVRDLLDRATGGVLRQQTRGPGRLTLRDHTRRYIETSPYLNIVLNLWMSGGIDKPISRWDEMFLPAELERALDDIVMRTADGLVPLVGERRIIHGSRRGPGAEAPSSGRALYGLVALLTAGAFLLLAIGVERKWNRRTRVGLGLLQAIAGALFGFPGLVVVLAWFTDHQVAHWNLNVFYANPLSFAMLPLGLAIALGSHRAWNWSKAGWMILGGTTVAGLAMELVPPGSGQANGEVIASYGVFNLVTAGGLTCLDQRRSMRITSLVSLARTHASRVPLADHSKVATGPIGNERR